MEHNGNGYSNGRSFEYGSSQLPAAVADRPPPHNIEAEQSVLGSILLDNDVMRGRSIGDETRPGVIEILRVSDFYRDAHQVIYQAMLDLYERGEPIDLVSLTPELERMGQWKNIGGLEYITHIYQYVPHSANYAFYAGIVKDKADERRLLETASEIIRDGYSGRFTAGELLNRITENINAISAHSILESEEEPAIHPLPDKMDGAAFYGAAGAIVSIIEPETEACREAILLQFLVMLGCAMGARPHWSVGGTVHHCNLFACLVGPTGNARKGTAFDAVDWLLKDVYPQWAKPVRGLVSGEGLVKAASDRKGPTLCLETEFGGTIGIMGRQNNSLCSVLKQAWDGPYLDVTTKNFSISCNDAHLSMIGHITYEDLADKLNATDIANGFANRFLWCHAYVSKELPDGGDFFSVKQALGLWTSKISDALNFAQNNTDLTIRYARDDDAKKLWKTMYHDLITLRSGRYGMATVRRAPMVMRLAVIFAVLDRDYYVRVHHLKAALAVWAYCDRTAAHIWGCPKLEGNLEKLLAFIANANGGVTRTDINRKLFKGRLKPLELDRLLAQAQATNQIVYRLVKTGGAPRHEWVQREGGALAQKG